MVEAVNAPFHHLPLIIFAIAAIPPAANGHVLDEYLQSTLVAIEPGDIRLKINLTPGIEIAEKVLKQIDHNGDRAVSSDEAEAYAEMLKRDLTVRLDGREAQLKLTASNIPEQAELRTGHGIIQMEFSITPCTFSGGNHRLTFENRHFNSLGVYLFNAARSRSLSIRIARQSRNVNQSRGEIEFAYAPPNSLSLRTMGLLASVAVVLVGTLAVLWRLKRSTTNLRCSLSVQRRIISLWIIVIVILGGCGSPTPPPPITGPPPPPPAPVPELKPAPPPNPQPDPFETAMSESSSIVKRYGSVYASVKDDVTADKAVEEIGRMTTRLRELTAAIGKIPYRAGQEKHALALQTDLTQLQTAQLSNPDMQRVLSDPDLGLKFIVAHQSFVTEGLLPLGQTVVARQQSAPQQPEPSSAPHRMPSTK
jgi:PBP1b-binding outer membrane lipoprotein LpoB